MCYIQQVVSSPSLGAYSFMLYVYGDSTKAFIFTPGAAFIVMNTETLQLGLLQHRSNSISNSLSLLLFNCLNEWYKLRCANASRCCFAFTQEEV